MDQQAKKYILDNIGKISARDIAAALNIKERKVKKFLQAQKKKGRPTSTSAGTERPDIPSRKKIRLLISALLIIAAVFIAYGNSLQGKLLWDDNILLRDNIYIQDVSKISKLFTGSIGASSGETGLSYRPIQMLAFTIGYHAWGLNPLGYHLLSLISHILVALCIYWLVNILYKDGALSLLTGLLYAVFPLHTSAVSYISGLADPFAGFFMLFALILYIRNIGSENLFVPILSAFCFLLAILSKEYTLVLGLLILVYHYTFKKKIRIRQILPIALVAVGYIYVRLTFLASLLPHNVYPTTVLQRIPGFFVAIANYSRLLLLPINLHVEYGLNVFSFGDPAALLGFFILCAVLAYAFWKRESDKVAFFSICWFMVTLLPQSNLYPIHYYMAEHWMYMPSIGFFLPVSYGLLSLYRNNRYRPLAISLISALLVFYTALTIKQNVYWRDPVSFYERSLKYTPDSAVLCNDLANVYMESGDKEKAINLYKRALDIDPYQTWTYNNLAILYTDTNRYDESVKLLKKLIEIKPDYPKAYNSLGNIYKEKGKSEEAVEMYKKALSLEPDYAEACNNLGVIYSNMDRKEEALELIKKAISLAANNFKLYYNLGLVYQNMGKYDDAIAAFKRVLELSPDNKDAYNNLSTVYNKAGKNDEAIAALIKAIEIDRSFAVAYRNIAAIYYFEKKYDKAIKYYDEAARLGYKQDPALAQALEPFRSKNN
ncbi:MAG: tetratricopeptide repeat protein [Candidatus Omnitrophica bacterium]|nr:tetratricopeptide repeat protein [Candidatus Omnitrophota bacterium]